MDRHDERTEFLLGEVLHLIDRHEQTTAAVA